MKQFRILVALLWGGFSSAWAQRGGTIDSMDAMEFKLSKPDMGSLELVEGRSGKAVRFVYPDKSKGLFATRVAKGNAEWDKAARISFWVKGDGSKQFGGLQLIWADDFAVRYDFAFPLDGTEWRKVMVPWSDLIPVLPGPKSLPLDASASKGNAPSKLSHLWFGKWWYWRDDAACSFAVDDIRLEPSIEMDTTDYTPAGAPLARVAAKLRAGQPVTIVTMGDSLTDTRHWTNQKTNWPATLKARLKERFGSEVTIVNPAIGGTQLRQNVVLIPLWAASTPEPDLVTVCFGYNDWDGGMRGPEFLEAQKDAVDRIRRATRGKADVLLMTPARALTRWNTMAELGDACRTAAQEKKTGLADLEKAFASAATEEADRVKLFATDNVHLSPAGQETVAEEVERVMSDG